MASEIRVNTINNRSGLGTITISDTGAVFAGVTTITSLQVTGTLIGVANTDNIRTNTNATFLQNVNVSGAVTSTGMIVTGVTTVAAGSTSAPSITPTGDSNTGIFFPSADTIAFGEGGTEVARFDSSGRFGIGTASPAPGGQGVHIHNPSAANSSLRVTNSTTGATDGDGFAVQIASDGTAQLRQFESLALTFETAATERARIDSSGRLLVGTSTASSVGETQYTYLQIQGGPSGSLWGGIALTRNEAPTSIATDEAIGQVYFGANNGSPFGSIACFADGTAGTNDYPGRLTFSTTADGASSPTERLRIGQSGQIGTYTTGIYAFGVNTSASAGTSSAIYFGNRNSSGADGAGGTTVFYVWSNGNVQNTNGSYTAISDAKLKENIVDAASQWDDLKAIQIRNWNFKAETGHETHRQIGPIAQELETVCPGLVFETPDRDEDGNETGEVTKGVNQSVLYMKAVKALQEAMERIEQLETEKTTQQTLIDNLITRVAALEAQ